MEKYYEIIDKIRNENGIDINKLFLLYHINIHDWFTKDIELEILDYCYNLWLNADMDLDLSLLADIVCDNWKEIKADKISDNDIIEMCK